MLGASLAMFALVSAFVAFGSWPGASGGDQLDQVLLNDVVKAKPKQVAVRSDAVVIARRAAARHQVAQARSRARTIARTPAGTPVAQLPAGATPQTTAAAPATGDQVAKAPTAPQQTQGVANNLDATTRNVGTQVQQQGEQVQTQVNQVVDQVIGPTTAAGDPVQQVKDAAGSLLGP
jgi:hypothetical protein